MNLVAAAQPRTRPKVKTQPHRMVRRGGAGFVRGNDGLSERDDRQDPERRQNGVVGRVVAVSEQFRLQHPGTGRENRRPDAPA